MAFGDRAICAPRGAARRHEIGPGSGRAWTVGIFLLLVFSPIVSSAPAAAAEHNVTVIIVAEGLFGTSTDRGFRTPATSTRRMET